MVSCRSRRWMREDNNDVNEDNGRSCRLVVEEAVVVTVVVTVVANIVVVK